MDKIHCGCVVKLEQEAVHVNVDMRTLTEDNPFHGTIPKDSVTRVSVDGAWRISDEDHAFLMDKARVYVCMFLIYG